MARVIPLRDFTGPADQAPPLDREDGTSFGWYERLFLSWRDGLVFDYNDWHARDIEEMLGRDYKARQLERVMCSPLEAAEWQITPGEGDRGQAEAVRQHFTADLPDGGMEIPFDVVISQLTSAKAYRKAFFELVWTALPGARIGFRKIAYRPATTCRMMRTPQGQFAGFEQEGYYLGVELTKQKWPIQIPPARAFVYIHGQRRDPMNGVSDLDVAYWCYKTKQKILFLWFQYAEKVSLPRIAVTAQDPGVASQVAQQLARVQSSGVVPVSAPGGPQTVGISPLDVSGKGGDQFQAIVSWLDQAAANSILAGFTNLTDYEKSGGSWALSQDASDFYLQTLESDKRELEREIRAGLFAPFVGYNFGPGASVPKIQFEPLNAEDKASQVAMLQALLGSRDPALVPNEFIEELAAQVAGYWGMPEDEIRKAFKSAGEEAKRQAALQGANPAGQQVAGIAGAVGQAVRQTQQANSRANAAVAP